MINYGFKIALLLQVLVLHCWEVNSSHVDVMKTMSYVIGEKVNECAPELKLGHETLTEAKKYWDPRTSMMSDRNIGCLLDCATRKLNLMSNGQINYNHLSDFVFSAGGDEQLSKSITQMYRACASTISTPDHCQKALSVNNCFRGLLFAQFLYLRSSNSVPIY